MALLPGSAFVFLQVPPIWRDHDSLAQIAAPPGHVNLLQFPPLYPFLARVPILLISGWTHLVEDRPLRMGVSQNVALNDGGVYILVAAQHLALILALALFVVTAAKSWERRVLLILVALATPVLFVGAHVVSSEALGIILMICLVSIAVHLFQNSHRSDGPALAAFGICLYLNIMTRHQSAVFAALLPLGYLFAFAGALVRQPRGALPTVPDPGRAHWWRKAWRAILVGVAAILLANGTTRVLCAVFGEPYRSTVSRTAIYRFDKVDRLPAPEREAFIQELQSKTDDPITKEAIPRLLEVKGYWGTSMAELERLIKKHRPPMTAKERKKLVDDYLNEICTLYFRAAPPFLVENIRNAIRRGLTRSTAEEVARAFVNGGVASLQFYRTNRGRGVRTAHLATCSPEAEARIAAFAAHGWFGGINQVPSGFVLLGSALAAAGLAFFKRFRGSLLILILAIAVTNLLLVVGTFAFASYSSRQVLPECVFAFVALSLVLAGAFPPRTPAERPATQ
ncbi:MAG: hypothetical protein ABR589_01745 [Chthoniobacterales bacterium]